MNESMYLIHNPLHTCAVVFENLQIQQGRLSETIPSRPRRNLGLFCRFHLLIAVGEEALGMAVAGRLRAFRITQCYQKLTGKYFHYFSRIKIYNYHTVCAFKQKVTIPERTGLAIFSPSALRSLIYIVL